MLAFDPDRFETDVRRQRYEEGRSAVDGDTTNTPGLAVVIYKDIISCVDGEYPPVTDWVFRISL